MWRFIIKYNEYEKYSMIYHKIYELAIVQEILFLLCDALSINQEIVVEVPNLKRLCFKIQDFIYEDKGYAAVEREMEKFSCKNFKLVNQSYELNIYRQFILMLDYELNASQSLESLMQLKHQFAVQILNRGINQETKKLFDDVNSKVLYILEDKVRQDRLYGDIELEISLLFKEYVPVITDKIDNYMGDNSVDCNSAFARIKKLLQPLSFYIENLFCRMKK